MPTSTIAILVAAGAGVRMGGGVPKALVTLAGRPMLLWSLDVLRASAQVGGVVVVAPPGMEGEVGALVAGPGAPTRVVAGAGSRSESVREGVLATRADVARIVVHDAARPLLHRALLEAVLAALEGVDGAIAARAVADTLKRGGGDGLIDGTLARAGLWAAETPQAFHAPALRSAIESAAAAGRLAGATDCASIVEDWGGRVRLVPSLAPNLKVTTAADAVVAATLLGVRPPE